MEQSLSHELQLARCSLYTETTVGAAIFMPQDIDMTMLLHDPLAEGGESTNALQNKSKPQYRQGAPYASGAGSSEESSCTVIYL